MTGSSEASSGESEPAYRLPTRFPRLSVTLRRVLILQYLIPILAEQEPTCKAGRWKCAGIRRA